MYKHVREFLKVNKVFKGLVITVDAQNVALLPLNNSILKYMGPTVHLVVMAHHTPIF
jgi:hypothetical protein